MLNRRNPQNDVVSLQTPKEGYWFPPEVAIVDREILTVAQAAEYLQFDPDKVYRLVRTGELPASKIGKEWRIRRADIEALLRATKQKSQPRKAR